MLGTLHARLAGARAFARAESRQANWSQAEMLRVMGERDREHDSARQSPDAPAQAEMLFKRALTIARQQGARSWELRAATSLAMLWRDAERPREAQKLLREVYGWFKEGRATNDLVRAKALLADLSTRL